MMLNAGRRTLVPLAQIPQFLQDATIATEDAEFSPAWRR